MENKTVYILGIEFNEKDLHKTLDNQRCIYIARNRWIHQLWKNSDGKLMTVLYFSVSENMPRFTAKNQSKIVNEEFVKNLLESESE